MHHHMSSRLHVMPRPLFVIRRHDEDDMFEFSAEEIHSFLDVVQGGVLRRVVSSSDVNTNETHVIDRLVFFFVQDLRVRQKFMGSFLNLRHKFKLRTEVVLDVIKITPWLESSLQQDILAEVERQNSSVEASGIDLRDPIPEPRGITFIQSSGTETRKYRQQILPASWVQNRNHWIWFWDAVETGVLEHDLTQTAGHVHEQKVSVFQRSVQEPVLHNHQILRQLSVMSLIGSANVVADVETHNGNAEDEDE